MEEEFFGVHGVAWFLYIDSAIFWAAFGCDQRFIYLLKAFLLTDEELTANVSCHDVLDRARRPVVLYVLRTVIYHEGSALFVWFNPRLGMIKVLI